MSVIADSREPKGHDFETEELPAGDYVITGESDGIIVERKEWTDLVGSYRSGKLFTQLRMCKEQDYRVVLLIEGNKSRAYQYANATKQELRRFESAVVAKMPEINLAYTSNKRETWLFIEDLDNWLGTEGMVHSVRETEKVSFEDRPRYIIEGMRGIGPKTAVSLVEHFGSVREVVNATEEELQEVPGVGPATAKKMIQDVS